MLLSHLGLHSNGLTSRPKGAVIYACGANVDEGEDSAMTYELPRARCVATDTEPTFSVGDRVRFVYPNESTGSGTIDKFDSDPRNKPYAVRLDVPWRAYREGRWQEFDTVYAHAELIRRIEEGRHA
jgi:hypothetical protein